MHIYFSSSSKDIWSIKLLPSCLKLFYNVKTKWIAMLFLAKRVLVEYKTLVVKMHDDLHIVVVAKTNLQYICDIEVVMGLVYIMRLLELVHALIRFVHAHDTFMCDFVIVVKKLIVLNYITCIQILKKNIVQNNSKCSWTCMKTTMIICWLLGGLILQQTSNLWFFYFMSK